LVGREIIQIGRDHPMATGILGGDVAQIREQATAYRTLGDNLVACGGNVVSTTDSAVAGLQEQISSAQTAVVSALQTVGQESRTVTSTFSGIQWTGANRAQVEEVGVELDSRVNETVVRIQEIFESSPPSSPPPRRQRASPRARSAWRWTPRPSSSTRS
jgi:hypothetical protein